MKARQRYNRIATAEVEQETAEKTNRSSTMEEESKSDSGDAVPNNASTVQYKRLWVKGENMEPSVTWLGLRSWPEASSSFDMIGFKTKIFSSSRRWS